MDDPLDPSWVRTRLSSYPFVVVDGVSNIRTLGNYLSTTHPGSVTRPNFIFRSGEISRINENGKRQFEELGIKKVFDLRSDIELERFGTPVPDLAPAVHVYRLPLFKTEDYSPEMIARRYKLYATGKTESFMELYSQILDHGTVAFGTIFRHIRDYPNQGILFHCTAGKDRTGVLSALILKLAGVSDEDIAEDYALTKVGREPERALVISRLSKEPTFADDKESMLNLLESRAETMVALLKLIEDSYGGVEKYMENNLGFGLEDVALIRRHLLSAVGSGGVTLSFGDED